MTPLVGFGVLAAACRRLLGILDVSIKAICSARHFRSLPNGGIHCCCQALLRYLLAPKIVTVSPNHQVGWLSSDLANRI